MSVLIEKLRNAQSLICQFKAFLDEIDILGDSKVATDFNDAADALDTAFAQKITVLESAFKRANCKKLVHTRLPYAKTKTMEPACEAEMAKRPFGAAGDCTDCCMHTGEAQTSLPGLKYMLIGPQGIGKTRHSARLAKVLGVSRVLDDGEDWPDDLTAAFVDNTLFISNAIHVPVGAGTIVFQVFAESDILNLIKALRPTTA